MKTDQTTANAVASIEIDAGVFTKNNQAQILACSCVDTPFTDPPQQKDVW